MRERAWIRHELAQVGVSRCFSIPTACEFKKLKQIQLQQGGFECPTTSVCTIYSACIHRMTKYRLWVHTSSKNFWGKKTKVPTKFTLQATNNGSSYKQNIFVLFEVQNNLWLLQWLNVGPKKGLRCSMTRKISAFAQCEQPCRQHRERVAEGNITGSRRMRDPYGIKTCLNDCRFISVHAMFSQPWNITCRGLRASLLLLQ